MNNTKRSSQFIAKSGHSRTGYSHEMARELEEQFAALVNLADRRDPSGDQRRMYSKLLASVQAARETIRDASREADFERDNIFRFARMTMYAQLEIVLLSELHEEQKRNPSEEPTAMWATLAAELEAQIIRLNKQFDRLTDYHQRMMLDLRLDVMSRVSETIETE